MTQSFSLADVESARRRLVSVDPDEVSIVDAPAILEPFSFLKNKDGGSDDGGKTDADEGSGEGDDKGAEDVTALVKDLFGGLKDEVAALAKSFADLKADKSDGGKADEDDSDGDKSDKDDESTLVEKAATASASMVIAALTEQGILKAPETAEDKFEKALTGFQTKSSEAFGKVEKAISSLDARVSAVEGQDGGSKQAEGEDGGEKTDVNKNADGDKNGEVNESTMFLSSLLASSLANPNQTQA